MATRILVTGGSGYVGRFLLPALEQDGYHVVGVSRSSSTAMDVSSASDCERVLNEVRPDVIVHTAALSAPATCEQDPAAAVTSNVARALVQKVSVGDGGGGDMPVMLASPRRSFIASEATLSRRPKKPIPRQGSSFSPPTKSTMAKDTS
ncbi:MAT2B [Symbiodinium sp. CCMP2592]|nr:MAT2B [Symbiodinium sp. CCMP2592]